MKSLNLKAFSIAASSFLVAGSITADFLAFVELEAVELDPKV